MSTIDLTKPYKTRDGHEAWAVALPKSIDRYGCEIALIGYIETAGRRMTYGWSANGKCCLTHGDNDDLVNVPETRTVKVWINVYPPASPFFSGIWPTREDADGNRGDGRIACIEREVTFEVGEGLEP